MISFKLFAGTDVGLRDNNEDNFTVCPDLSQNEWIIPADHQQVIQLGERGCIIVVADGMGGQNAGEVASAIAIATVQNMFSREEMPDGIWRQPSAIKDYLKKVVKTADAEVKAYSAEHPDAEGLGSTIVIAWIISNKIYVCWLGDSRAYAFVPGKGIGRLSKDHSYVQQLVDAGAFTEEEAMMHPNSNVITRSLGDATQKAKPEVAEYPLEAGEIILLCSDGLCGVCKDEEIGEIIEANCDDLKKCKDKLTEAALDNDGSDNITIALLQVCGGVESASDTEGRCFIVRKWKLLGGFVAFVVLLSLLVFFFPKKVEKRPAADICFAMPSIDLWPYTKVSFVVKSHSDNKYVYLSNDSLIEVENNAYGATVSIRRDALYENGKKSRLIVVAKADSTKTDTLQLVLKRVKRQPPSVRISLENLKVIKKEQKKKTSEPNESPSESGAVEPIQSGKGGQKTPPVKNNN